MRNYNAIFQREREYLVAPSDVRRTMIEGGENDAKFFNVKKLN